MDSTPAAGGEEEAEYEGGHSLHIDEEAVVYI